MGKTKKNYQDPGFSSSLSCWRASSTSHTLPLWCTGFWLLKSWQNWIALQLPAHEPRAARERLDAGHAWPGLQGRGRDHDCVQDRGQGRAGRRRPAPRGRLGSMAGRPYQKVFEELLFLLFGAKCKNLQAGKHCTFRFDKGRHPVQGPLLGHLPRAFRHWPPPPADSARNLGHPRRRALTSASARTHRRRAPRR